MSHTKSTEHALSLMLDATSGGLMVQELREHGLEPVIVSPGRLKRRAVDSAVDAIDRAALGRALAQEVDGEVRFDAGALGLYAMDASNYMHVPIGVVIPRTADAVVAAIAVCRSFAAPIVARAGGTALAGQTCNRAVVLDFSKYMNRVLELNPEERFARVQPGTICDDVVRAARPHELTWGPQPATHDHCGFGGMIANNSGGIHAQIHGTASNNVEELDVVLYDGTRMTLGWTTDADVDGLIARGGRIGAIHARLRALRDRCADRIRAKYPRIPRRVSGYNLDELLPGDDGRFNLARAMVGSEGTLATMLQAKVRLVWNHPARVLAVLGFEDVYRAGDAAPALLQYAPIGLEGLDDRLIDHVRAKAGPHAKYLPLLPQGKGWLLVELGYAKLDEAIREGHRLIETARKELGAVSGRLIADPDEQSHLWQIRESGLGATAFVPGQPDTWPGWEDSAVPPDKVGPYLRDLRALLDRYHYNPALYGHFGMGCIHCRIDFDLSSETGIASYRAFVDEAADLVVAYGGSLSGEHGDGQSRSALLEKMFGAELVQAFRDFKAIWDPDGRMNPGRIADPYPIVADLRLRVMDERPSDVDTHFKYPDDHGSFAHATMRCVGIGKCRRMRGEGENQTMCPSFMVTREEKHTTRGRAHLLWEMLQDGPLEGGWQSEEVLDSLDLCLSCKGCKGDCPVNVDIATYKAEFLSRYWKGRIRPRQAYAFGLIDRWARMASLAPGLVNLATRTPGLRQLAKLAANIPAERSIPTFAPQTFRAWFERRGRRHVGAPRVVLWADTFNNYFFPDVAKSAVRVLESAGYEVVVPRGHLCCGRPLYDYGMLDRAERYLDECLGALGPHLRRGERIVVLEPSCASVFRDEARGLFPDRDDAKRLVAQTRLMGEFLAEAEYDFPPLHRRALVHGHCHHKSVLRFDDEEKALREMRLVADVLASGCCGMAGSFGYERDKYEISQAVGERVLLPAVRAAPESTILIADGFSCREQILQGTGRRALHVSEVIDAAIEHGPEGPPGPRAEAALEARHRRAVRGSMLRAAAMVGAAVALAGWMVYRRLR
jgi:FAD/FMN-containing dehydrogenase/Fe-S oxidoreductase